MNSLPIYVEDEREDFVYVQRPRLGSYWRLATATGVVDEVFRLPVDAEDINNREQDDWERQQERDDAYEDGYACGFDDGYDRGREDERDDY